jgi:hypothetical protein
VQTIRRHHPDVSSAQRLALPIDDGADDWRWQRQGDEQAQPVGRIGSKVGSQSRA